MCPRARSADGKARFAHRLLLARFDVVDAGAPRALAAEPNEPLHRLGLALEDRLDRAVAAVLDRARHAVALGEPPHRVAEEDALDVAADDDAAADPAHRRIFPACVASCTSSPRPGSARPTTSTPTRGCAGSASPTTWSATPARRSSSSARPRATAGPASRASPSRQSGS